LKKEKKFKVSALLMQIEAELYLEMKDLESSIFAFKVLVNDS
jgi:hypothetical protein